MDEEEYGGDYYEGKKVYFHKNKGMLGAYLFLLDI